MGMFTDKTLGANESTNSIFLSGSCDLLVQGLTSGTVKLQYLLPASTENASPSWEDFPDGAFTEDVYKTLFISETKIQFRLTGVSNNAGVYVRLGRYEYT